MKEEKLFQNAKKLGIYPHAEFLENYLLLIDRLTCAVLPNYLACVGGDSAGARITSEFKRFLVFLFLCDYSTKGK